MTSSFSESAVEDAALAWLESLGYSVKHGLEIAPGELGAGRSDYGQVVLERPLRDALPPKLLSGEFLVANARDWWN